MLLIKQRFHTHLMTSALELNLNREQSRVSLTASPAFPLPLQQFPLVSCVVSGKRCPMRAPTQTAACCEAGACPARSSPGLRVSIATDTALGRLGSCAGLLPAQGRWEEGNAAARHCPKESWKHFIVFFLVFIYMFIFTPSIFWGFALGIHAVDGVFYFFPKRC